MYNDYYGDYANTSSALTLSTTGRKYDSKEFIAD